MELTLAALSRESIYLLFFQCDIFNDLVNCTFSSILKWHERVEYGIIHLYLASCISREKYYAGGGRRLISRLDDGDYAYYLVQSE